MAYLGVVHERLLLSGGSLLFHFLGLTEHLLIHFLFVVFLSTSLDEKPGQVRLNGPILRLERGHLLQQLNGALRVCLALQYL